MHWVNVFACFEVVVRPFILRGNNFNAVHNAQILSYIHYRYYSPLPFVTIFNDLDLGFIFSLTFQLNKINFDMGESIQVERPGTIFE